MVDNGRREGKRNVPVFDYADGEPARRDPFPGSKAVLGLLPPPILPLLAATLAALAVLSAGAGSAGNEYGFGALLTLFLVGAVGSGKAARGDDAVTDFAARGVQEAKGLLVDDIVGREAWRGSKFGYVTGASMLVNLGRRFVGVFTGSFSRVSGMYANMVRGEDTSHLPVIEEADASARFAAAMEAYGKTDDDLGAMAANSFRGFYFYALMLAVMVTVGAVSLAYGNITGLPGAMDVLLRFATVPALAALMLRFGHLNWVVRNRRLDGPGQYLLSGGFLPARRLARAAAFIAFVAVLGLALAPGQALASTVTDVFGEPDRDDVFFNMLGYIVPGVGPVTGFNTDAHRAVAQGFLAFSGVLMFIGSMMLGWHVLVGTVSSAYTGKVLGERWHQIWAPARVTLGLGSLAPVAGGYGAAQVLVVYLIVWGGNFANSVWTPYIEALGNGILAPTSQQVSGTDDTINKLAQRLAGAEDVIYQIARREICNATVNRYNEVVYQGSSSRGWFSGNDDTSMVTKDPTMQEVKNYITTISSYTAFFFRSAAQSDPGVAVVSTQNRIDYGAMCGSIEVTVEKVGAGGANPNSILAAHYQSAQAFDEARVRAINEAVRAIRPKAKEIAATYVTGSDASYAFDKTKADTLTLRETFAATLRDAAAAYRDTMVGAARQQLNSLDVTKGGKSLVKTLVEEASTKGWANAGAYYVTLAQVQSAVYGKAMTKPSFEDINLAPGGVVSTDMLKSVVGTQGEPGSVAAFESWWGDVVRSEFSPIDLDSAKAGRLNKNSDSSFSSFLESLGTDGMLVSAIGLFKDMNPFNPMKSMIDFGHTILMYFYIVVGLIMAASVIGFGLSMMSPVGGVASLAGSIGGLAKGLASTGGLGSMIVSFFTMLLIALFAVGVVHAYVIPMIPYIQVLFFLAGMLVLLVEALIAAPLWAFFHIRMDGAELVEQVQRPGYMIAFNLLLRPVLMIIGLMLSFFVFGALAWFVSNTFTLAAVAAGGEHSVGPIGTIVMVCILTYLDYQIALRSFSLINQVPDRVTRWFGHNAEGLGEESENRAAVGFAVGNISSRTEGLLRAGGAGAGAGGAMRSALRGAGKPGPGATSGAGGGVRPTPTPVPRD